MGTFSTLLECLSVPGQPPHHMLGRKSTTDPPASYDTEVEKAKRKLPTGARGVKGHRRLLVPQLHLSLPS